MSAIGELDWFGAFAGLNCASIVNKAKLLLYCHFYFMHLTPLILIYSVVEPSHDIVSSSCPEPSKLKGQAPGRQTLPRDGIMCKEKHVNSFPQGFMLTNAFLSSEPLLDQPVYMSSCHNASKPERQ